MRSVALLLAVLGCGGTASPERRYLGDRELRRAALVGSLVNPDNAYSRLRLAHYGRDWDALPEWNPKADGRALEIDDAALAGEPAALRALGERAFFRYPVQLYRHGERVPDAAERLGVQNLVRVELAGGETSLAVTCATCHVKDGIPGLANERLDLGRWVFESVPGSPAALLEWGPGRLDVTTDTGREPVRIPDLRPTRWLTHLHADATIAQTDVVALAIRIETLIITSNQRTVRPPRVIALALATYLWSLADSVASRTPASDGERHGADLFAERCEGCHQPPGLTGPPIPLARVGTDPAVGRSLDRGTGFYRVPSLHGVGARGLLLHDGSVRSLAQLLDPARTTPGHRFGHDLSGADRADLIAYLDTL